MRKFIKILLVSIPIILMIGLIPLVSNDYLLTALDIVVIVFSLTLFKVKKHDGIVLVFGFVTMIISEYFFVHTGVETFTRHSLFGLMPLWLPFLWSYAFVAIKRSVEILGK